LTGIGKAIIVLIILGVALYFLWPYLQELISTGGHNYHPPIKCKSDIITVEGSTISNSNPYSGSTTTLTFLIKNNGDRVLDDVEINFFNVPGFNVSELRCEINEMFGSKRSCNSNADCQSGEQIGEFCDLTAKKCYKGCLYKEIDPTDTRETSLVLQVPPVNSPTPLAISYYIRYNYSGYRTANIPIIDGVYRTRPFSQFSQSTPGCSPVVLEFESRVGSERREDSKIIKEYWSRVNEPFEVKMNFKHVGSSLLGIIQPVNLTAGSVKLDLNNSLIKASGPCNFCDITESDCPVKKDSNYLFSKKNVLVPGTLICNFENSSFFQEPEMTAVINAEFNYIYQFTRTERFTVQPLPKE